MMNFTIKDDRVGKRLDKFLSEEFFSLSRGEIIRQIKNGKVWVNEKKEKPSYRLEEGDGVRTNFKIIKEELEPNGSFSVPIIFEDENVVVLDKPWGIQMHPSPVQKEHTVANWLVFKYPQIKNVHDGSEGAEFRPGLVHRLDKNTSGIVVVTKTKEALLELKRLFQAREVEKVYTTLVYGNLDEKEGIINEPIAKASSFKKQKVATGKIKGKEKAAITEYKVLKSFNGYDLAEARPKTGRMHQIRVHLASIGHPVVGDEKYFRKKYKGKTPIGVKRQLLHASSIKFELFGQKYQFFSEIPTDFSECLKGLTPHQISNEDNVLKG